MLTRASIVVFSHLSDIQDMNFTHETNRIRINFVKYVIHKCDGDLNKEIDPDELWSEFTTTRFYKS